eukprot:459080-Karenia_brevis.AAC.1
MRHHGSMLPAPPVPPVPPVLQDAKGQYGSIFLCTIGFVSITRRRWHVICIMNTTCVCPPGPQCESVLSPFLGPSLVPS